MTPAPLVEPLASPGTPEAGAADLWRPGGRGLGPRPGLLLVHGLTPDGKRDSRLAWTADRLARAGFLVAVPELPAPGQRTGARRRPGRPRDPRWPRRAPARAPRAGRDHRRERGARAGRPGARRAGGGGARRSPPGPRRLRRRARARPVLHDRCVRLRREHRPGRRRSSPRRRFLAARNPGLVPEPRDRGVVSGRLEGRPGRGEPGPGGRAVPALLRTGSRGADPPRRPSRSRPASSSRRSRRRGISSAAEPGSSSSTAGTTPPSRSRRASGSPRRRRTDRGWCWWG
jgi:hypothetical protein